MRLFKTIISVITLSFVVLISFGCTTTEQKSSTNNIVDTKPVETKQVETTTVVPEKVEATQPQPVEQIKAETPTPALNTNEGIVKKSSTSICHAPGTTYYNRTTNFTPYNSVDDCLASGGRLPKK